MLAGLSRRRLGKVPHTFSRRFWHRSHDVFAWLFALFLLVCPDRIICVFRMLFPGGSLNLRVEFLVRLYVDQMANWKREDINMPIHHICQNDLYKSITYSKSRSKWAFSSTSPSHKKSVLSCLSPPISSDSRKKGSPPKASISCNGSSKVSPST